MHVRDTKTLGIFNIIIVVLECISGINILSRQSIHVAVKDRNGDTRFVIIYNRIKIFYSAHVIGLEEHVWQSFSYS